MTATLNDPGAEAAVIAAGLAQRGLIGVMANLPNDAFTTPAYAVIHGALVDCHRAGDPRDHSTVLRRAMADAGTTALARTVGEAMTKLLGKGEDLSVGFHVDRLLRLRTARTVAMIATRLTQAAGEAAEQDDTANLIDFAEMCSADLGELGNGTSTSVRDMPMSLDDLLAKRFSHDWLIPDLLERADRMILTGFEGTGKSFLVAQFAMCVSAGLHPFLGTPAATPARVLVVDAENSERQTARRYRMIRTRVANICADHGIAEPDWSDMVRFVIRPEGIALNDPRVVQRIERAIAATEPHFVAMGPLYRLHKLDTRDEQAAKELTDVIDRLRVKYRFAIACEAHVAHGQPGSTRALRPTGSSLFLRWPEFGLGLRPASGTEGQEHPNRVDLAAWRGGREDRAWPRTLAHSGVDRRLPWNNDDPDYLIRARSKGIPV